MENKGNIWNKIYENKQATEVSWYEPMPEHSLNFVNDCELKPDAAIIDIGGGDSFLAEFLIARGFTDITVLDVSEAAIERAKKRMGEKADQVTWIISDVTDFVPERQFDLWHDRAAFHFLIEEKSIENYLTTVNKAVKPGGFVVLATFSETGPETCSGMKIRQYSIRQMQELFTGNFLPMSCKNIDHTTPSGNTQNFTFCRFEKL